ncbi:MULTISPECIES: hypothetical protein [Haloplanus]|jgi:hypothetical protein|uniref:hypothetical protein n=1 Tax=Haloplanus TaxID=376170 RepID=UPI0018EEC2E1|nr:MULTISPECIES: hypothetical protein [Haloplanus]
MASKHVINGLISTLISVGATVVIADDDDAPWGLRDVALAVGISAFLSGYVTSYFAER